MGHHLADVLVEHGCDAGTKSPSQDGAVWPKTKEGQVLAQGGSEVLKVTRNNANDNMCWLCMASTGTQDLLYTGATQPSQQSGRTSLGRMNCVSKVEQVPVWMERSGLRWEHVMIDVLHGVDQAVMSHVAANALLRGHEFWPQGDIAARADPACERRSAPLVRSESRRPSHPRHALFGPSASQCRDP